MPMIAEAGELDGSEVQKRDGENVVAEGESPPRKVTRIDEAAVGAGSQGGG